MRINSLAGQNIVLVKKAETDEEIVRGVLVEVWTEVLEKYARPGMVVPPVDQVRKELLRVGENAAVNALVSAHWWMFSFMARPEVHSKIEAELNRFDLQKDFLDDVLAAQTDAAKLQQLRDKIRKYVLNPQ